LLSDGQAVVADFGIAQAIGGSPSRPLTQTGMAIGSPSYMSPEQAGGGTSLDGRADVYALGCVLFEMLAGQPPFVGVTTDSVIRQHFAAEPPDLSIVRPGVPGSVSALVRRALAKVPVDRFQTAAEMADAVTAVTLPGVADSRTRPVRRARRHSKLAWLAL